MNKVIDTSTRVFMSIVGPSGCGKTFTIFDMLSKAVFKPKFDRILYFYQHDQAVYKQLNIKP